MSYAETSDHAFYVSVIDGARTGLLYGPLPDRRTAEENVERVRTAAIQVDDRAHFYAFGVARVTNRRGFRPGRLNAKLDAS